MFGTAGAAAVQTEYAIPTVGLEFPETLCWRMLRDSPSLSRHNSQAVSGDGISGELGGHYTST
jgi:hypothetical protein